MTDKQYQLIERREDYHQALLRLLELAQRRIEIFDPDLTYGGWENAAVADLLQTFLARSGRNELSIIVHDSHALKTRFPRLTSLMQTRNHQIRLAVTTAEAAHIKDSFVLIDNLHSLRRFHSDHDRAALELNAPETASILQQRFTELRIASAEEGMSKPLGL